MNRDAWSERDGEGCSWQRKDSSGLGQIQGQGQKEMGVGRERPSPPATGREESPSLLGEEPRACSQDLSTTRSPQPPALTSTKLWMASR